MNHREAPDRTIFWLLGVTVACYGIGYPVALFGHSALGWVLVFLGGPCLLALGVLMIRRIHRSGTSSANPGEASDAPPR